MGDALHNSSRRIFVHVQILTYNEIKHYTNSFLIEENTLVNIGY